MIEERDNEIMVLAEETRTWALRWEARRLAGKNLMQLRQYQLALEQFEAALQLDPANLGNQRDKGLLLALLGRHDQAREWTDALLREHGDDPENWFLLGRLEQEDWVRRWREGNTNNPNTNHSHSGSNIESMLEKAGRDLSRLIQAIEAYMKAFVSDPANFLLGSRPASCAICKFTSVTRSATRSAFLTWKVA